MTDLTSTPDYRCFGKWSMPGVPHKGWTCTDIEDLGGLHATCDMCERRQIRYVHAMQHPDYPDTLFCGCICAGHVEENLTQARQREAITKNAARRRAAWPDRKGWRRSTDGKLRIRDRGIQVTVFPNHGGWQGLIRQPATGYVRFSKRVYPNERAVQFAAFDVIQSLPPI